MLQCPSLMGIPSADMGHFNREVMLRLSVIY